MKVRFSFDARNDLREIAFWIEGDNPHRAETFVIELTEAAESLTLFPRRYPDAGPRGLRRMPYGHYLIFYRVTDAVEIIRIIHGARDWPSLLDDLG